MPQHDAQARDGSAGSSSPRRRLAEGAVRRPAHAAAFPRHGVADQPVAHFWSLLLRLARALLPVATLYVGKLIIDDVVRLVQMPDRPTTLRAGWTAAC